MVKQKQSIAIHLLEVMLLKKADKKNTMVVLQFYKHYTLQI